MTTAAPAQVIREAAALGTLRPGAAADVTLLEVREGPVVFEDAMGERVSGTRRLVPVEVIRDGVRVLAPGTTISSPWSWPGLVA